MTPLYTVAWPIVWVILKLFFFLSVKGKEHMPKKGAVVICANHVHALDPVALAMVRYRQIHFMAKKELFRKKSVSWLLTALGAFSVDREGNDIKAMRKSMEYLKSGEVLGFSRRVHEAKRASFLFMRVQSRLRCAQALRLYLPAWLFHSNPSAAIVLW